MQAGRIAFAIGAVGVVAVGGWLLLAGDDANEEWGVVGTALDPATSALACQQLADGDVTYALTSDIPSNYPMAANVSVRVADRSIALRVADCLRDHGAEDVEISKAESVKSFSPN